MLLRPWAIPPYLDHNRSLKFALDTAAWTLAAPLAYLLQMDGTGARRPEPLLFYLVLGAGLKVVLIRREQLYAQTWHRVGLPDLLHLTRTVVRGGLLLLLLDLILGPSPVLPGSTPALETLLALLLMGGYESRCACRSPAAVSTSVWTAPKPAS